MTVPDGWWRCSVCCGGQLYRLPGTGLPEEWPDGQRGELEQRFPVVDPEEHALERDPMEQFRQRAANIEDDERRRAERGRRDAAPSWRDRIPW